MVSYRQFYLFSVRAIFIFISILIQCLYAIKTQLPKFFLHYMIQEIRLQYLRSLTEDVAVYSTASKLNSYQPKQNSNEKNNNLWNGVDHSDGDAADIVPQRNQQ